jgi:hypothetical protein
MWNQFFSPSIRIKKEHCSYKSYSNVKSISHRQFTLKETLYFQGLFQCAIHFLTLNSH